MLDKMRLREYNVNTGYGMFPNSSAKAEFIIGITAKRHKYIFSKKQFLEGEIIMRKLMNKKGFSLVELMIVVVIMGILVAVAIPLYGAIQDNAKNKTCKNNMTSLRSNATNYYASNDVKVDAQSLASTFDDKQLPICPWGTADYNITYGAADGSITVKCVNTACKNHIA